MGATSILKSHSLVRACSSQLPKAGCYSPSLRHADARPHHLLQSPSQSGQTKRLCATVLRRFTQRVEHDAEKL